MLLTVRYLLLRVCILAFIISGTLTLSASAQWSEDPAANLAVSTGEGELNQPKISPHPDGGSYISWFGNEDGYNVYLQRLDAEGNLLWDETGLLVAARSFTSTQDYGLTTDTEGNAVLTFRDDRLGGTRITAAKVSASGEFMWGENGIDISGEAGFVATPRIAATSDGGVVVAYTSEGPAEITKLSADGTVEWEQSESASSTLAVSDIKASLDEDASGSVIIMYRTFGPPTVPGLLSAQKYDANGSAMWGVERVEIMTSGSLQMGNFPHFILDGDGGMVVSWYQSVPIMQSYVQHIHGDGSMRFALGGIDVSLNSQRLRTAPEVAIHPDTKELFVFWRETDGTQNQIGLYGQRISGEGELEWGNDGLALLPVASGTNITNIQAFMMENEPVVAYARYQGAVDGALFASRLSIDAEYVWEDNPAMISDFGSTKSRLTHYVASENEVYFAWADDRSGSSDIYAQNMNADGSLGEQEEEEPPVPVQTISFSVDMSIQELQLTFQPDAGDIVHLLGGFNDWSVSDESALVLDADDPGVYALALELEGEAGETVNYKYYIEAGDGRDLPNGGWENDDVGPGENGNRVIILTEEDQQLDTVFFNNLDEHDTSTINDTDLPESISLEQNYPNPFNPATTIPFTLHEASQVRIEVYNALGQRVAVVINEMRSAGSHTVSFDASTLASGLYLYRLQSGDVTLSRKMTVLK